MNDSEKPDDLASAIGSVIDGLKAENAKLKEQLIAAQKIATTHAGGKSRREMYAEKIDSGEWSHNSRYDAFYEVETGTWVETCCSDANCFFCKDRPPKHV